jgi:hypothetical protein
MTVLTIVVGALFVITGGVKVIGVPQSLEIRDHFGMSPGLWRVIGLLETSGAVGTLVGLGIRPLGVAALIGLCLLMVGAVVSRLRVRDAAAWIAVDVGTLALVVVTLVLTANRG